MSVPVQADGPISFSDGGAQYFIPLGELSYSAGAVDLSAWVAAYAGGAVALPASAKTAATAWVGQLVKAGQVTAGTVSSPPPPPIVMLLKSRFPGSIGNAIQAKFTPVAGGGGKFDADVSATQTYVGLTAATIQAVLGTSPGGGSSPGLAYVAPGGPAPLLPRNMTLAATASGGNWEVVLLVFDQTSAATALTLYTVGNGNGAIKTTVTVANADKASGKFDLTITWQYSAAGLAPAAFQADANFSYLLDVEPPTAAGTVGAPGPGTVVLMGGADPTPATAVVLGT
jgi:hypothetical protein